MNWFERHLNWSLLFGTSLLPFGVGLIFTAIFAAIFWGQLAPFVGSGMDGLSEEVFTSIFLKSLPLIIIAGVVNIALSIFAFIVAWWYLGQKARSKWFLLLLLFPGVLSGIYRATNSYNIIFALFILLVALGCAIIFYRLENRRIGYGGDFADESATSRFPDTGPYSRPDDRQLKELDYTPAKNVMDIVDSGDVKGIKDVGDVSAAGGEVPAKLPAEVQEKAVEKVPVEAPAADIQEKVTTEVPAEAIEESPAEALEEAPEEIPAEAAAVAQVAETASSQAALKAPILLDDAGAVIRCFYHPGADAVNLCSRCKQYVCNECNYVTGTNPICRNCWEKRAESPIMPVPVKKQESPEFGKAEKQKGVESGKPEKQKTVASGKSEKPEAKKNEWLGEFMALYEQASPIINVVTRKSADGMPSSPLDLMEGLKLRPMLELAKKLSKPKEKELREAKNEFEQVLSSCIKIADAAADFVSGGGQALLGGLDFARIVDGIETANVLMGKLSQRLTAFSQSQD